jgi:hypothetical protein
MRTPYVSAGRRCLLTWCILSGIPVPGATRRAAPDMSSVAVVVVTNRPVLLERYALPGLVDIARAGMDAVVVDQSGGGAEAMVRAADVRLVRCPPPLARGRNAGIAATDAEVVAFADDDAEFDSAWASRIGEAFDRDPAVGAIAGRGVNQQGRLWPGARAGVYRRPTSPFGLCNGFNLAFRRAALEAAGPFDEELGAGSTYRAAEDTDMVYRIMRADWAVLCSDDVTVVHHEWRSIREELQVHYGYGLGVGAQTAGHLAQGDVGARSVAWAEALKHVRTFAVASLTLRLRVAALQPPFLAGMATGFLLRRRALASAHRERRERAMRR